MWLYVLYAEEIVFMYIYSIVFDSSSSNGLEKGEDEDQFNEEKSSPGFSGGLIEELASLFDGELKPVAPKAQKKVPKPFE